VTTTSPNAAERFSAHVARTRFEDLSEDAVARAKVFILDTFGVGISGSTAAGSDKILAAASRWGRGDEALIWGRSERLPAAQAALVNGYQVHCQEYDCVHEGAVLHPMATLLPAALGYAEREGGISGRDLITAVAVGVDVSTSLGVATSTGLRFFRPATSGGFGAAAGVAKLAGLDEDGVLAALGLQYAQASGTMQAHTEGSMTLPLQVGLNGRAGLMSADFATAGAIGPRDIFEGRFGFLRLFEGEWDLEPWLEKLGKSWRISEVSHKPYPAGRAAHAAIEGLIRLRAEHGFTEEDVETVIFTAPQLITLLASRPDIPSPNSTYAQLCTGFIAAKVLMNGRLDLSDYRGEALTDARTHEVAKKAVLHCDDNPDPNALVPQTLEVHLKNGQSISWTCEAMLASPTRRLTREQHLAKFRRNLDFAFTPLRPGCGDRLIAMVDDLETLPDVSVLASEMSP
jgi:aconitate decarboxylase